MAFHPISSTTKHFPFPISHIINYLPQLNLRYGLKKQTIAHPTIPHITNNQYLTKKALLYTFSNQHNSGTVNENTS